MSALTDHRSSSGDDSSPAGSASAVDIAAESDDSGYDDHGVGYEDAGYEDAGYEDAGYEDDGYEDDGGAPDGSSGRHPSGRHPSDPYASDPYGDGHAQVEQDSPAPSPAQLRVDFGAHFEANYQRLVAQLYAITLIPAEAHDVVQDAYSRAWRDWAVIGSSPDPTAWIRRVAVRSTIRSWRQALARIGIGRPRPVGDGADPRTGAMIAALGRLSPVERRCVVLFHMAGASLGEIAAVEQVSVGTIQARLARARHVVTEGMADVLPEVLGMDGPGAEDGAVPYDAPDYDGADYGPADYGPGEYDSAYDATAYDGAEPKRYDGEYR